jgi:uncharacterized protein YqeY
MSLKDRIREDMKAAMRGGEKRRLGVIRLIMAAVKQREVDDRIELDDGQVTVVLDKMVKQRRESQSQYEQAQRADLAEQEAYEITVLQEYLPVPLSDTEIAQLIEAAISETGASSMKDMGKVMGVLRPRLAGRADMGAVSGQIKARLGS